MKSIAFTIYLICLPFLKVDSVLINLAGTNDDDPTGIDVGIVSATDQTRNNSEEVLDKKKVLLGKASMLIPREFVLMDANSIALKYPSAGHRPSEVYTNPKGTINIALNHTKNTGTEADLESVKKVMDAQFNRPPTEFIKSEIKKLSGKKFIILEFVSQAADTKIYNLMAITSLEGRLAMITFNCTNNYRKEWEPIGKRIIESIELRP